MPRMALSTSQCRYPISDHRPGSPTNFREFDQRRFYLYLQTVQSSNKSYCLLSAFRIFDKYVFRDPVDQFVRGC
jgi:hypothetical protein